MQVAFVIFIFLGMRMPPAGYLDQNSAQMGATWGIGRCADRRVPRDSRSLTRYF